MKKQVIGFIVLAATLAFSTAANAANTVWRGFMCISGANAACNATYHTGECFALLFTPPNIGTNGPHTRFTIFSGDNFAENYTRFNGSLVGTTFQAVTGTQVAVGASTFPSTMRFTTQAPATITATTKFINLQGGINDFDETPGCNMSLRASVTLQP